MEQIWFKEVENDLTQMEKKMARDFRMRAGNIFDFAPVNIDFIDLHIRPSLVFLMTKLFSGDCLKIQPIASAVQFIHLATLIHYGITDSEDKFKPRFPVLIGLYLYSEFFSYLSQNDALEFLAPLSEVICQIHVGGILRKETLEKGNPLEANYLDAIKREYGLLMSQACLIPAIQAGVDQHTLEHVKNFGFNVGMALGITREENTSFSASVYIDTAEELLPFLPAGSIRDALQSLIVTIGQFNPTSIKNHICSV